MASSSTRAVGGRFLELISRSPVIPAVRQPQHLPQSIAAPSDVVYLLCGSVMTVRDLVAGLREGGKAAVVNIDLLGGLAGDVPGVQFLESCGVSGVISTHTETLRASRARGLLAIQRSFLLDSHAVANSLRALERFLPDAVELLPAPAAPRVVAQFAKTHPELVLTAGGLIGSLAEIDALVRAGIRATSVSDPSLWIA
ncbi:MAG: glycerol-3-phosphate responsive antiterminator [Candidatus Baltobacteraceae bacterium]